MGGQKVRVGTGELVDSLSLDAWTGFLLSQFIAFFRDFPNWTVRGFKTKSANVDQFFGCSARAQRHHRLVGESAVYRRYHEEHGTAPLGESLAAAEKCLYALVFPSPFILIQSFGTRGGRKIMMHWWIEDFWRRVSLVPSRFHMFRWVL